jgi:2-dehydropantoate 2-reductase
MKVCIYGGGAIGGYIAGHLARAGECEVSVVARGKTLEAIRSRGLSVTTPQGSFTVYPRATDNAAELGPQDYVFITLKAQQFGAALEQIAPLLGAHTAVIPPTTGIPYWFFHQLIGPYRDRQLDAIDRGGRQWSAFHPSRVIGCVYWIGAHSNAPGCVAQDGAQASCPIGEPDGSESERVTRLAALLTNGGINSRVKRDIRGDIWVKAINSLCWNPVAALTLARMGEIGALPEAVELIRSMMVEADAVGMALGMAVPYTPEKRITVTLSAPAHKMSMLQDMEAGRQLEWGAIEASFRAVRDLSAIATPTLDTVMALMKLRAGTYAASNGNMAGVRL